MLRDDSQVLNCAECEFAFHVGTCSGVTDAVFKTKRESFKKNWKCESCRCEAGKSATAGQGQRADGDMLRRLVEIDRKLSLLIELPAKVDGLEQSVQLLSDQFDSIQRRLENHDQEIKDVKHRVEKIEKSSGPQALAQLQLDVDALEWRSRRLNIEIHGIPDTDGEDLLSKVNDLAVRLEVGTLAGEDISAVHRLPARPGRTRGIIVRFARQELRDTWLAKRGVLRNSEDRVFICENMTSRSRGLLSAAKQWLKQSGYKYAWHANGKILVRRATGDSATIIKCEDDLRVLR